MDKIQEQHFEACLSFLSASREAPKHATITEDMMGRFAEWVAKENWGYDGQGTYMRNERKPSEYKNKFVRKTTPELIQLFKQTL